MPRNPLKLIVPITEWKEHYRQQVWHVQVLPSAMNGLSLSSSADAKQVRSVNLLRFKQKLGALRATEVQDVVSAIAIVLEYK